MRAHILVRIKYELKNEHRPVAGQPDIIACRLSSGYLFPHRSYVVRSLLFCSRRLRNRAMFDNFSSDSLIEYFSNSTLWFISSERGGDDSISARQVRKRRGLLIESEGQDWNPSTLRKKIFFSRSNQSWFNTFQYLYSFLNRQRFCYYCEDYTRKLSHRQANKGIQGNLIYNYFNETETFEGSQNLTELRPYPPRDTGLTSTRTAAWDLPFFSVRRSPVFSPSRRWSPYAVATETGGVRSPAAARDREWPKRLRRMVILTVDSLLPDFRPDFTVAPLILDKSLLDVSIANYIIGGYFYTYCDGLWPTPNPIQEEKLSAMGNGTYWTVSYGNHCI